LDGYGFLIAINVMSCECEKRHHQRRVQMPLQERRQVVLIWESK